VSRVTAWDAFWRAAFTCWHPRVLAWSLLPLALVGAAVGVLGWLYWEAAVDAVQAAIGTWSLSEQVFRWLHSVGAPQLRAMVAPLVIVALAVPVVLLLTLLLVALLATPAVVRVVAQRRFADLQARGDSPWWRELLWALSCTAAAVLALVLSLPLWLVPPLVMVLPPLIWGWLTCRVLAHDVLSRHASAGERRQVMRSRRWSLLAMGVASGYLAALPSLLWAVSSAALLLAPLLMVVAVWLYTMVFVFCAAWFAHFCLAELQALREAGLTSALEPQEPTL
jgi:Etoposide-induced protein 2.4 (EI24)